MHAESPKIAYASTLGTRAGVSLPSCVLFSHARSSEPIPDYNLLGDLHEQMAQIIAGYFDTVVDRTSGGDS